MSAPYSGRCACGQVGVMITAEPIAVRQCWCRQCQRISGGGATNNAMFPTKAFALSGEVAESSYTAASGNTLTQVFCPRCATPVLGRSSARPQFRSVRLGLLDEGHGLKPDTAIWVEEAPDWAFFDPALARFDRQPPAPTPSPLPGEGAGAA